LKYVTPTGEAADADAAAPPTAGADKGFSAISNVFGLKIAPMAETSNRNTCAPAAVIPARAPLRRLVNTRPFGSAPDQYLRTTGRLTAEETDEVAQLIEMAATTRVGRTRTGERPSRS